MRKLSSGPRAVAAIVAMTGLAAGASVSAGDAEPPRAADGIVVEAPRPLSEADRAGGSDAPQRSDGERDARDERPVPGCSPRPGKLELIV